ncbi:hypothetical protein BDR26DRAFT_122777 [Obelidium mucronatum]|nr:hypothetical protein BDR26DRAFT_122777 [Obelidium mucronatum]
MGESDWSKSLICKCWWKTDRVSQHHERPQQNYYPKNKAALDHNVRHQEEAQRRKPKSRFRTVQTAPQPQMIPPARVKLILHPHEPRFVLTADTAEVSTAISPATASASPSASSNTDEKCPHLTNRVTTTCQNLYSLFATTKLTNPGRLIYALAGACFHAKAPLPFGGRKATPGFAAFQGRTVQEVLVFIIEGMYTTHWKLGTKVVVKFVCDAVNRVVGLQKSGGCKDTLDELMMRGMKRSGHIDWFGAHYIPKWLRHVEEHGGEKRQRSDSGVFFSVRRRVPRKCLLDNVASSSSSERTASPSSVNSDETRYNRSNSGDSDRSGGEGEKSSK